MLNEQTEAIDNQFMDLDLKPTGMVLDSLLDSQRRAFTAAEQASNSIETAVTRAHQTLSNGAGRLILLGAGASGRLAIQDGAELWPTFGWPHERLLLCMAGGNAALVASVENAEDDIEQAMIDVKNANVDKSDVVVGVAASGQSPWTCTWLEQAKLAGALTIGIANNSESRLLLSADCPVFLNSGAEVLAGSTRMAAGTAQKIALNVFSTALMIRLNRTYGNLMVDMAAVNSKLDKRRMRLLQGVLPDLSDIQALDALKRSGGWVKLAALVAKGDSVNGGKKRLEEHKGSLRSALDALNAQ